MDAATLHHWLHQYGYGVVAAGALAEGETVLLLAGAAARAGTLQWPLVVAVGAAAGWVGDQLLFALGRLRGRAWLVRGSSRWPALATRVARVQGWVERHPSAAVFGVRFAYGLRLLGPFVIGTSQLGAARFAAVNALGALCWAALWVALGGIAAKAAQAVIDRAQPWLLASVATVGAVALAVAWARARRNGAAR